MKPWENEPNAKRFTSAEGYPVVLKRNYSGAWCGYVGVPKHHPWHGKDYDDSVPVREETFNREVNVDMVGVIPLLCAPEDTSVDNCRIGLAIDVHGGLTWSADGPAGEVDGDGNWWFGFDCSHSGDLTPKMSFAHGGVYRPIEYVEQQARNLAAQLKSYEGASNAHQP